MAHIQLSIETVYTPLSIETVFFLYDAQQSKCLTNKFNRFYFNYPSEWLTSYVGEEITGVRNIWLQSNQ